MRMMKKYISFLFAALLLGTSCSDTRTDYMMEDTVYFPNSDLQKETLYVMNANDYVHNVWIHKAGYYQGKFAGKVELDYNYLIQYNTDNGTNYEMLDAKYYSFERDFVIEAGSDEVAVPLTLKIEQLLTEKGYGVYYVPLSVNSRTPGEDVYVDKAHFILALEVKKPVLALDGTDGEQRGEVFLDFSESTTDYEIDITSRLDINTTEDLSVTYSIDESLLTEEEKEHLLEEGFDYAESVNLAVGEKYAENYLTLKPSEMPDGKWILPIRMGTTNEKVGTDKDANWLKLTVVKGTLDAQITFETSNYLQGSDVILSSENTLTDETIARISESSDFSFTVTYNSEGANWLTPKQENGKIQITVDSENSSIWQERVATITLKDNVNWLEKDITVRQGIKGAGLTLNKALWNIVGYSDNVAGKANTFFKLYDNFWPANRAQSDTGAKNSLSYIEVDKASEGTPVQFVFDLGENPHAYSAVGLMPRLQWIGNSPKYMKIEVSDDNIDWRLVGDESRIAFTDEQINKNPNGQSNLWMNKLFIAWHQLGDSMVHRYIRLSLWGTWSGTICLDEIFVSLKD